jgi:Entner-Doudoroff aldolase
MKRMDILNRLQNCGVIAVVRGDSAEEAVKSADALVAGGLTGLELTYTVPNITVAITKLKEKYVDNKDVVVGAGTVLDAVTARIAILAGAEYIVSPCFDAETAELCNLYQIPYLPGCMTITEIKTAMAAGCDIVKVFPGSAYGPSFIKAVKTPLPHANIMPTGGVSLENMDQWLDAGCVTVGVGGNLLAPAATGEFAKITELAKEYMDKLAKIRAAR